MDLTSSGLRDRLGSLSAPELPPAQKEENNCNKPIDTVDLQVGCLVQRCVIIQRDEKGYGLTVSGDNPVFVQLVKEDGAAARAGVQQGDRIIKVNGTLVTQSNHVEVVQLIKSGSYVALTLLGRPLTSCPRSPAMQQHIFASSVTSTPQPPSMSTICHKPSSPTDRITGPQPVNPEKQQELSDSKIHTMRMMLEQELSYVEKLRSNCARTGGDDKIRVELAGALKRVKTLQEQLDTLTTSRFDSGMAHSPRSPPATRMSFELKKDNQDATEPPSLPPRRHPLPHQTSLPNVCVPNITQDHRHHHALLNNETRPDLVSAGPPCLTQPNHSEQLQWFPSSNSLENIQRSNFPVVTPLTSAITVTTSATTQSLMPWLSGGPTHSRQRSSPDALLHQTENLRHQLPEKIWNCSPDLSRSQSEITGPRRCVTSDSFSDSDNSQRRKGHGKGKGGTARASSFGTYDNTTASPRVTPPGTPPPPYGSSEISETGGGQDDLIHLDEKPKMPLESNFCAPVPLSNNRTGQHHDILSMEDDFTSEPETTPNEEHGPFNNLQELRRHPAHLSVFMFYLISNSDPSSLFFYLITELYRKGNAKEMKKWAYEIHSSFLVPQAPLKVNQVDESVLHEIDNVLQNDLDKEEILRKVFWKARKKASEELKDLLEDFCNKRTLGLGSFFGPNDVELNESHHDKAKELKIIENLLLPSLINLSTDMETSTDNKMCAIASSIATLLYKWFGVKSPQAMPIIERCPIFVTKEKSKLKFLNRNKKPQLIQGHHFIPQHYFNVTYCNHCQLTIWGVGNQGYQCQNCEMNVHKACVKVVEETCIGAMRNKKDKKKDRKSGIMENIIGKMKPEKVPPSLINRRNQEDVDSSGSTFYGQGDGGDETGSSQPSRVEKLKNRYETLNEGDEKISMSPHLINSNQDSVPSNNSSLNEPSTNGESGKRGPSIGRSESLRTRREHQRQSFRKRSDPNIPQSKSDAEDTTGSSLHPSASSSSCSSSTRSLDSPSNSLETVSRQPTIEGSPTPIQISGQHGVTRRDDFNDSDLDAEADPPNWTDSVDWEIVRHLKPKERKRQEVINELFHTERTHVRNLKVLEKVFYRPMLQEQILPTDQIKLLFGNLEEMLEIHCHFNSIMKSRKAENVIVGDIGCLMLEMFDGQAGKNFREAAAKFCKDQSIALEALRSKQKKDQKLAQFLVDAEGNHVCRRLQLKDFIPTGMQRLTKYPLLLENLAKYTTPNTEEYANLMRTVECCKENLNYVNQKVKETENYNRLLELQKRLDRGPFDKVDHPIAQEFRSLDLTKYTMIHEGPLTWRISRQKMIDLQVLLLDTMLVLVQKQDEKYVLKFHKEETKMAHSPIIKLDNIILRNVAVDKKAFFIVITSPVGPQIYELVAISNADRSTWLKVITEAVDAYKARDGKAKRPDSQATTSDKQETTCDEVLEDQEKAKDRQLDVQENQEVSEPEDNSDHSENPETGDSSLQDVATTPKPDVQSESEDNDSNSVSAVSSTTPSDGAAAGLSAPSPASSPCGLSSTLSDTNSPTTQSPSAPRDFPRADVSQTLEGPPLIEPCEVIVRETAVLQTAEAVLTPLEKLRRKDIIIHQQLQEKQDLIAEVLRIPKEEYNHIADIASEIDGSKNAKELVLAAIAQATQLTEIINESLNLNEDPTTAISEGVNIIEEGATAASVFSSQDSSLSSTKQKSSTSVRQDQRTPSAPVHKLIDISKSLQQYLTHLLRVVSDREDERDRMRKELRTSREQIHILHESRQHLPTFQPSKENIQHSRPSSFISIGSSAPSECSDLILMEDTNSDSYMVPEEELKTPTGEDNTIILAIQRNLDEPLEASCNSNAECNDPSKGALGPVVSDHGVEINVDGDEVTAEAEVGKPSDIDKTAYGAVF